MSTAELILAPIQGATNATFRAVFNRQFPGFDWSISPFITTTSGLTTTKKHFRDILPAVNKDLPVVPQLLGNDPHDFARMARQVCDMGYDCVNWNLGCPSPTVTRKNRGCALLSQPDRIRSFLDTALPLLSCRMSIKTRLGFTDPDDLLRILPALNEFPLAQVIVHPRTGSQQYEGSVDLERYGRALAASTHPVIYNGDITTVHFLRGLEERFPLTKGWMIGRGALMNPFLVEAIKQRPAPTHDEALHRLQRFHSDLYECYKQRQGGPAPLLGTMKELWGYLSAMFAEKDRILKRIRKTKTPAAYEEAVRWALGECSLAKPAGLIP